VGNGQKSWRQSSVLERSLRGIKQQKQQKGDHLLSNIGPPMIHYVSSFYMLGMYCRYSNIYLTCLVTQKLLSPTFQESSHFHVTTATNAKEFLWEVSIFPTSFQCPCLQSGPVSGDKVKVIYSEASKENVVQTADPKKNIRSRLAGEQSVRLVKSKLTRKVNNLAEAYGISKKQERICKSMDTIGKYQKNAFGEFIKSQEEQKGITTLSMVDEYSKTNEYDSNCPKTIQEAQATYAHLSLSSKLAASKRILQSLWKSPGKEGIRSIDAFAQDCKHTLLGAQQVAKIPSLIYGSTPGTRSCDTAGILGTSITAEDITDIFGSRQKWLNDAVITRVLNALNRIYKESSFAFPSQLATSALLPCELYDINYEESMHHEFMKQMIHGKFY
jgi:hypothetical protein